MRNNPKCQKCFGTGKVFMAGGPTQQCDCFITNPAPKEEEMQCVDCGVKCADVPICNDCNRKRHERWTRTTERRTLAREAYMAALGGVSSDIDLTAREHVNFATADALETVRRWDTFMAAVDAEGGE